ARLWKHEGFYFGGLDEPASECDAGPDGAGADCAGGLESAPDELLLEPDEELDEEPDPDDEEWELAPVDDPEPPPELEEDEPVLWSEPCCEEPEPPTLRVAPASGSPLWPFPPPSCFGGLLALGGLFFGGLSYGGSGCFLWGYRSFSW
ncbi:MAG TPA: hypothetical protein VIK39_01205, partial [Candidatus Angelobacter sp.]